MEMQYALMSIQTANKTTYMGSLSCLSTQSSECYYKILLDYAICYFDVLSIANNILKLNIHVYRKVYSHETLF